MVFVFMLILAGCNSKQVNKKRISYINLKDTINVVDIVEDFNNRLLSTGIGVNIQFFDIKHNVIGGLNKNDTFFIQVDYISKKFVDLVKNHSIELYYAKGDFNFISKESTKQYKIAVGSNADTIQFDVFLKSNKFIFNDYFLKNGEISYHLTDKISLCRLIELPK